MPTSRTLLATDFSPAAQVALETVGAFAARDGGVECLVLHALQPEREPLDLDRIEDDCRSLARRLTGLGARVSETLILRVSDPESLINGSARELSAALVVVGRSARGLGATLRGLIRAATCPVLVVGPECTGLPVATFHELAELVIDGREGVGNLRVRDLRDAPPLVRLATVDQALQETALGDALLLWFDRSSDARGRFGSSAERDPRATDPVAQPRGTPRSGAVA